MDQLHSRWILHLLTLYIKFSVNECITRTYYIGIKEETWNYAPSGKNLITGKPVVEDKHAPDFLQQGQRRIGSVYKKAIYKEFTDLNYDQEILKPDWLGFLGPVLRAEVDDVIVVHLKNFASRPYSLHPHGVFYEKDSEGALYPDGTTGRLKHDDAVSPGEDYTYTWIVKPEYAPTDGDANCLTWVYHSHGDAPRDIYSGLIGALLTCKKGTLLQKSGHPTRLDRTDVDKDFFLMFSVVDENLSWYLEENIETFCSDPAGVDPEDKDFQKSNKMHGAWQPLTLTSAINDNNNITQCPMPGLLLLLCFWRNSIMLWQAKDLLCVAQSCLRSCITNGLYFHSVQFESTITAKYN